jgi:hypothetical protein
MSLWLAPAAGVFLMAVSCVPIAKTEDHWDRVMLERGDPLYGPSQISGGIAPVLVLLWAALITVLMVITVVLPLRGRRDFPLSTSDNAFIVAAIVYMVVPMALLVWLAMSEGRIHRGVAYLYLPWYVPAVIAGTAVYALALICVLIVGRRPALTVP